MIFKYATRNAPEDNNVILIYRCNYQLIYMNIKFVKYIEICISRNNNKYLRIMYSFSFIEMKNHCKKNFLKNSEVLMCIMRYQMLKIQAFTILLS